MTAYAHCSRRQSCGRQSGRLLSWGSRSSPHPRPHAPCSHVQGCQCGQGRQWIRSGEGTGAAGVPRRAAAKLTVYAGVPASTNVSADASRAAVVTNFARLNLSIEAPRLTPIVHSQAPSPPGALICLNARNIDANKFDRRPKLQVPNGNPGREASESSPQRPAPSASFDIVAVNRSRAPGYVHWSGFDLSQCRRLMPGLVVTV